MARYLETIDVPLSPEKAFEYMSTFSNTAEWDPGVVEAERLDTGPVREGSTFRVVVSFLGRRIELVYEITAFEPPGRVVLIGENESCVSEDEITFAPRGDGTRITYDARLRLKGPLALFDPGLQLSFLWIGRQAVAGLRAKLGG